MTTGRQRPPADDAGAEAPIARGFADPGIDGQRVFRALLDVASYPGAVRVLPTRLPEPPEPLNPAAFAYCLTLVDFETPVWLDAALDRPAVVRALRFHCNCPIADDPAKAAFALIGDPSAMPPLAAFAWGEPEYPDRSTTLLVQVPRLSHGNGVVLAGPGVRGTVNLRVDGLPARFWTEWRANRRAFPRGVDAVFAAGPAVAALPRSVHAETGA